jgi:hypothetical protein
MTKCLLKRRISVEFTTQSGPAKCANTKRGLTHSLDHSEEGLAMKATQAGTHGHQRGGKKSPTYLAWDGMIQRVRWPAYIEQGITVSERWRDFGNFLADMGEKPEGLCLGRVGGQGNYEPGNVQWMTRSEVLKNRTRTSASLDNLKLGQVGPPPTHGHARREAKSPTYATWTAMIHRTTNPDAKAYPHYGGRGITACERWRNSFEAFLADMGERPDGLELDRYPDNDGGYWCGHCEECARLGRPANCRWATRAEQMRNTRSTRFLTYNGKTQCLTDWAAEIGLSLDGLRERLKKGLSVEEALTRPRTPRGRWAK